MEKAMDRNARMRQIHALMGDVPHLIIALEEKEDMHACSVSASFDFAELCRMLHTFFVQNHIVFEAATEALISARHELQKGADTGEQQRAIDDFMRKLGYEPQSKGQAEKAPVDDKRDMGSIFRKKLEELGLPPDGMISRAFVVDMKTGKGLEELSNLLEDIIKSNCVKSPVNMSATGSNMAAGMLLNLLSLLKASFNKKTHYEEKEGPKTHR